VPAARRQCHAPKGPGRYDSGAMSGSRRARPTIRCLRDDLGLTLPWLDTDLGAIEDPWLDELRRIAPVSPQGQKRVLSIGSPLVYRLRFSAERGVTWVDGDHGVVWLCAVHRRQEGSDDDAYTWFAKLHADGKLLPSGDDRLRDRAEAVIRLQRGLTAAMLRLVDDALARKGTELAADLGGYLPCRVLVRGNGKIEEIWCALSARAADGTHVRDGLRDLLFVALETRFPDAVFEIRADWPGGRADWWEAVRLGLR
jgi:hypothetical protein